MSFGSTCIMYSSSPGTLCVCSTNIKYLNILNKNVQILTIFLETYLGPFVAVRVRVFVSLCKITSLKILFLSAGNKQCHPSCTFIQPSLQNTKLHILNSCSFYFSMWGNTVVCCKIFVLVFRTLPCFARLIFHHA